MISRLAATVLLLAALGACSDPQPVKKAPEVKCPVMIQICEHDNLVSQNSALNTARALGERAEVRSYPIGHFDIYIGAAFEQSIADQLDFFNRHLMASSP